MKNSVGYFVIAIAVVTIGWAWADEERGVLEQVERQLEPQNAEALEAERREREPSNRREQERQGDREKDEITKRLAVAVQRRESLVEQFGEDHPEVRDVTQEIKTLHEVWQAVVRQEEQRHSDRKKEELREKLERLIEHQNALRKNLREDHPAVMDASNRIDELRRELETIEHRKAVENRNVVLERRLIAQKIEHLHAAAGHLDEAGMHDMARELRKRAEVLERELHGHHAEPELGRHLAELHEQMQDMKREIEKLRGEVGELRERIDR